MSERDWSTYRQKLTEMASRLSGEVSNLRREASGSTGISVGGAPDDQPDPGTRAADEDLALSLLGTQGHTLAEINAALERMARKTFGTCENCGKAIGKARLDSLPYARLCIDCAGRKKPGNNAVRVPSCYE